MVGEPEKTSIPILSGLPGLIAGLSIGVLLLAFCHEWGFFGVIGPELQWLLTSSDYFTSAVSWLPAVTLAVLIALFVNVLDRRGWGYDGAARNSYYSASLRRKIFDNGPFWLIFAFAVGITLKEFIFGDWYSPSFLTSVAFAFFYLWVVICKWLRSHKNAPFRQRFGLWTLIAMGPPLLGFAFAFGTLEGLVARSATEPIVYGRTTSDPAERPWILIRALSDGALVREIDGQTVQYFRWSEIRSLQKTLPVLNRTGLACRMFSLACSK